MIAELDRPLSDLRRRALLAAWSAELGRQSAPALFAFGCVVLVGRIVFDVPRSQLGHVAWLLALLPWSAWLRARSRVLSRAGTAAWLDLRTGGQGAILTAFAVDDARWQSTQLAQLHAAVLPRVRFARPFAASLPALVFVAGTFWLDPPLREPGPATRVVEAALERVREKLAVLEETVELPEQRADELVTRLERISEELGEARPESTFEALDRVEADLAEHAQQALEDGRAAHEGLAAAASPGIAGELAQQALEEALAKLRESGLAKVATELPPSLQGTLEAGTLRLPAGVELDGAQLSELSKELSGLIAGRMDALARAGLLEPRAVEVAKLDDFEFKEHECDEVCTRGGT